MVDFYKGWVEFAFLVVMIIGLIVSIAAPSAVISYMVIFVSGFIAGRFIYHRKKKFKAGHYIIMAGFLIGYLIGSYYGDRQVIIIMFFIGAVLSHYMYDKKIIRDVFF